MSLDTTVRPYTLGIRHLIHQAPEVFDTFVSPYRLEEHTISGVLPYTWDVYKSQPYDSYLWLLRLIP
jgi:hypothetical protein